MCRAWLLLPCLVLKVRGWRPPSGIVSSTSTASNERQTIMRGPTVADGPRRPSQYYSEFIQSLPDMRGKTVVITGASRGLGFVTVMALVQKGASVISLNRESARAKEVQAEISEAATGPDPQLVECDLLDFSSVREAAARLKEIAVDGIDVLVCNAGIMLQPDEISKDGYDITISTNVLSHFLLAKELMPELEKAAARRGEARVVSMSSGSGYGPPAFNPVFYEKKGESSAFNRILDGVMGGDRASYERYHQSKLANLLFTSALHEKLQAKQSKIMALACTPGVCGTDMFVHAQTIFNPGKEADLTALPSVEDGALAQIKCICDPAVSSGELYGPAMGGGLPVETPLAPPTVLVDADSKAQLWAACEGAVGQFDV